MVPVGAHSLCNKAALLRVITRGEEYF